jgi:uncharacterized protein
VSAARPLRVGVSELLAHPGTRRAFDDQVELDGLAISTAAVAEGTPIDIHLVLESIGGPVTATGTVGAHWTGPCRRCLEAVTGYAEAPVREIFEPRATEGETYPLTGEQIDLEPMVRDAVLLALPLAPLCAESCAGPAPDLFPTGPPDEHAPPLDPRWAALRDLELDLDLDPELDPELDPGTG